MYKLKTIPEDFQVKEIPLHTPQEKGKWTLIWITKKDLSTPQARKIIAARLGIEPKNVKVAGNKDRYAVTQQMAALQVPPKALENLAFDNMSIEVLGKSDKPVSLGELKGNKFTITIREIDALPEPKKEMINYFGEQRFQQNNADVGRALVKKDIKKAAQLRGLPLHEDDPMSLRMCIHAYQSLIWNKMAKILAEQGKRKEFLPMIGFGTRFVDKEIELMVNTIMKEEGITLRSFVIRALPDISAEGTERPMHVPLNDWKAEALEENDLGEKKKVVVSFSLPKGSYATIAIAQLFGEQSVPGLS